jgi:hypothetical protein
VLEGVAHGARRTGVHGEDEARPVGRGAENLHLLADAAAVLVHELPDPFEELFASEIVPGESLFGQFFFHDPLSSDSGMIRAGYPERGVAEHAVPADHDVFDRHKQGVADVQLTGHVRRRHDDHEWLAVRSLARLKIAGIVPAVVDAGFDEAGVIGFGKLGVDARFGGFGDRHGVFLYANQQGSGDGAGAAPQRAVDDDNGTRIRRSRQMTPSDDFVALSRLMSMS